MKTAPLSLKTLAGRGIFVAGDAKVLNNKEPRGDIGGSACDQETRVVIEEVQDFDATFVAQLPMGEVTLPGFVRLACLKGDVGRAGRLRGWDWIRPLRERTFQMVEMAGALPSSRPR